MKGSETGVKGAETDKQSAIGGDPVAQKANGRLMGSSMIKGSVGF
jgi:hypothetical protein